MPPRRVSEPQRAVRLSDINLNLLVALDALLAEKSVTRAARHVGVTQSAMSHSLQKLRELFGDPLLVRGADETALSPRAARLAERLHHGLREIENAVRDESSFDAKSATRQFVIAGTDFMSSQIMPTLLDIASREAPRITFDVRWGERRLHASELATGACDLALGALLQEEDGVRKMLLFEDDFACAVRKGHPSVRGALDLDTYARLPHAVIAIGDPSIPNVVDLALAARGKSRHVAVRIRFFLAAPLVVAESDLLITAPRRLLQAFASSHDLVLHEPPIEMPVVQYDAAWHERFEADPAHAWLRSAVKRAADAVTSAVASSGARAARRAPAGRARRSR